MKIKYNIIIEIVIFKILIFFLFMNVNIVNLSPRNFDYPFVNFNKVIFQREMKKIQNLSAEKVLNKNNNNPLFKLKLISNGDKVSLINNLLKRKKASFLFNSPKISKKANLIEFRNKEDRTISSYRTLEKINKIYYLNFKKGNLMENKNNKLVKSSISLNFSKYLNNSLHELISIRSNNCINSSRNSNLKIKDKEKLKLKKIKFFQSPITNIFIKNALNKENSKISMLNLSSNYNN